MESGELVSLFVANMGPGLRRDDDWGGGMRRFLALLAALTASAATAQSSANSDLPRVEPSAPALQLARKLDVPLFGAPLVPLDYMVKSLTSDLLRTHLPQGPNCDPAVATCRATAERLARESVSKALAARQEFSAKATALALDEAMTAAQMRAGLDFVNTSEGQALVRGLALSRESLTTPGELQKNMTTILLRSQQESASDQAALVERLYDETRHLPRATVIAPPAPGLPSRSPRNP